jgi:hypothetical protein
MLLFKLPLQSHSTRSSYTVHGLHTQYTVLIHTLSNGLLGPLKHRYSRRNFVDNLKYNGFYLDVIEHFTISNLVVTVLEHWMVQAIWFEQKHAAAYM